MDRKPPLQRTTSRATIGDVAARAGVSIATVSRAINGTAVVAEETARRVEQAIYELNYVPQPAARILAGQKAGAIGLMLPEISGAFFPPLLRGVEAETRLAGYDLLIHATDDLSQGKTPHRALGEHNTDGLIVFIDSLDTAEVERLHRTGFPLVLLHQSAPADLTIPTITIENKDGAYRLVEHLIQVHNRRRIVYLQGPPTHEDALWRERGYRQALEANGIDFDPTLVADGYFSEEVAFQSILELIRQGVAFDAVFSGDDAAASGVLVALKQAGIAVPEAVAVAGFDDVPVARYLNPPLTTVSAPTEQVGRAAVQQLLSLICGEEADPITLLPTRLVVRSSCGCVGDPVDARTGTEFMHHEVTEVAQENTI